MLDGNRLQLQQGPINLVIKAFGAKVAVQKAYQKAIHYFPSILPGLVLNLEKLKQTVALEMETTEARIECPTSQHMIKTTSVFAGKFVTPMACVAGAVADQVLSVIRDTPGIDKAFVNNGGDIAVYLTPKQSLDIGVVPSLVKAVPEAKFTLRNRDLISGVATSGWNGPSFSRGIADAVTVLAGSAAEADIAATLIANEVNVESPAVTRKQAFLIDDTSDLGSRLVTTHVGVLSKLEIATALENGLVCAQLMIRENRISAALISVKENWVSAGSKLDPYLSGPSHV